MRHPNLLISVVVLSACSAEDRRPAPPPTEPTLVRLASATQHDLGRELDAAELAGTWSDVKRRWQGQRVRWSVTRQRALCRSAETCNVAAFPIQRPAQHGWMPLVKFAPGEFAALEAACPGADLCEVTIEGRLAHLDVSGERPTNLTITNATLVAPRLANR